MDLGKKTPWHLAINGGLVPVLELPDGTIIHESKIIMDFIEEAYPTGDHGYSLLPSDPVLRAKMRLAFPLMDTINGAWFPIYMKKSYDEELFKKLHEALQKVEDYLASNASDSKPFALGTEHPT